MTTVKSYNCATNADTPMGLLRAQLAMKNGKTHDIELDLASLRAALAESGGVGLLAVRLPTRVEPILVAVCGQEVDQASGKVSGISLKQVASLDVVRVRVSVNVDELPRDAKAGKAIVVQKLPGLAVQAQVGAIQHGVSINLASAGVGDCIRAGDFSLPEGMHLMSDPNEVVFRVEPMSSTSGEGRRAS